MCRLMCLFSEKSVSVPKDYLKRFVQASRNGYHGMGWGIVWIDENGRIHAKRSTEKIWKSDWKGIERIKSRCIIIHARQANPSSISMENTHPITIFGKNFMVHNGIISIDSFPELSDDKLNEISQGTTMDTRKYLATYLDALKIKGNSYEAFKEIIPKMGISLSANAFIVNQNELHIIKCRTESIIGGMCELYVENKKKEYYCISAVPFNANFKKIPNNIYINYNFKKEKIRIFDLSS